MGKTEIYKRSGFIAGGLLTVRILWSLIINLPYFSDLTGINAALELLYYVGYGFAIAGLFLRKDKISICGMALLILRQLIVIIRIAPSFVPLYNTVQVLFSMGIYALLLFAFRIKGSKAKLFGFAAGGLFVVSYFTRGIMLANYTYVEVAEYFKHYLSLKGVVTVLLNSLSGVFIGLSQSEEKKRIVAVSTDDSSTADKLEKLKSFLDNGVITQEEFDAKKKQLLGL